jgi:hypothetical protein
MARQDGVMARQQTSHLLRGSQSAMGCLQGAMARQQSSHRLRGIQATMARLQGA